MGRPILGILAIAILAVAILLHRLLSDPTTQQIDAPDLPTPTIAGDADVLEAGIPARRDSPTIEETASSSPETRTEVPDESSGGASRRDVARRPSGASGLEPGSAPIVQGDFPAFVAEVADTWGRGTRIGECKSPPALLREMAAEQRQDFWAKRVEQELHALAAGIIPASWQLSVGCRSTICQAFALQAEPLDGPVGNYWGRFEQAFLASPLRDEFSSIRKFSGQTPSLRGRFTSGFVLTSRGHDTDEPETCFPPFPAPG